MLRVLLDRTSVCAQTPAKPSVPDALFDRWERARRLGFAPDASIYNSSAVFGDVNGLDLIGRIRCLTAAGADRYWRFLNLERRPYLYPYIMGAFWRQVRAQAVSSKHR